jgi:hypothetical protein
MAFVMTSVIWPLRAEADAIFSDSVFNSSDWQLTISLGSVDASQVACGTSSATPCYTGASTGTFREIVNTTTDAPSSSCLGSAMGIHTKVGATYDPQTAGAIASVDYSEEAILLVGGGEGQASNLVAIQNGQIYFAGHHVTPSLSWTNFSFPGLRAIDFNLLVADPCQGWVFDTTSHPDFSASGSTIQFGFARTNSTGIGGSSYSETGGIGNWMVVVHTGPCGQATLTPSTTDYAGLSGAFWNIGDVTVTLDAGLSVSNGSLGSRVMAEEMSLPYFVLKNRDNILDTPCDLGYHSES